jgi:hypothetical protein
MSSSAYTLINNLTISFKLVNPSKFQKVWEHKNRDFEFFLDFHKFFYAKFKMQIHCKILLMKLLHFMIIKKKNN